MANNHQVYTNYRRGLIQRHIAANGRLLQAVWMTEENPLGVSRHAWLAVRRQSNEILDATGSRYTYRAFPVIFFHTEHDQPRRLQLAGGGDNPLLMGGLALATFAIESLLGISKHSLSHAGKLLAFFDSSIVRERAGAQTGFFTRKRHLTHTSSQFSMDEICGMTVGLLFATKAGRSSADQAGAALETLAVKITKSLGAYLKRTDYVLRPPLDRSLSTVSYVPGRGKLSQAKGRSAFVWQWPFGRAFQEIANNSYQCGETIPDAWAWEPMLEPLVTVFNAFRLDFNYTPRELFDDALGAYGGLLNLSQESLWSVTMAVYCLILVIDSTGTNQLHRFKFARRGNNVLKAIMYDTGPLDGAKKPFRHNCLFAVVAKRCAQLSGDSDSGWHRFLDRSIGRLLDGSSTWFADLPLCTPRDSAVPQFRSRGPNGNLWGGWYAWTANGTHYNSKGYTFARYWDLRKATSEIGPYSSPVGSTFNATDISSEYAADPSRGLRIESSGLDFLFARALAAYWHIAPPPTLTDGDPAHRSLPLDGIAHDGFLANASTGELHDLSVLAPSCQTPEIKPENARWFSNYQTAHAAHFNDCNKCLARSRQWLHNLRSSEASRAVYVGNKRTNEVHLVTTVDARCNLQAMKAHNKLLYVSLASAYKDGLNPCEFCLRGPGH
ncbi:MAG TPA: hypothetical protein VGD45_28350 [Steroidobacter sp.]|uniref:hypothetical protein n=1 Tax=Steroidobacter sp. TaxID=1978227 RepID=UPI002EDA70A4